jgi:hypothetical protein
MPREMTRRYLTRSEAVSALGRGKSVDALLGPCSREGNHGIRWVQVRARSAKFELHLFESADSKSEEFTDVYEFAPLDPDLDGGDADEVQLFSNFDECLAALDGRWPGASSKLVNEFVIQDEYAEYLRSSPAA